VSGERLVESPRFLPGGAIVVPAKAGIQTAVGGCFLDPAFAGVTSFIVAVSPPATVRRVGYASAVTGLEARYSVDLPTRIVRATAQGDAALSMGAGVHDQPVRSALTAVYEGLRRSHVDRRGVRSGFCHRFAVAFRIRWDRSPFLKDFQPWPNNSLSRSPKPAPSR